MASFSKQRLISLEQESIRKFQTECIELVNQLYEYVTRILSGEERRILAEHMRTCKDDGQLLTLTGLPEVDKVIRKLEINAETRKIIEELRPRWIKARYIPAPRSMSKLVKK